MFNTCVAFLCVRQVDEDYAAADYRLQYRRSGSGGSQYEDAYIGRDCEFLVLHLDPHTDYQFRVCARGEGRTEWSPWSVPQTGYTTLAPHGGWSCQLPSATRYLDSRSVVWLDFDFECCLASFLLWDRKHFFFSLFMNHRSTLYKTDKLIIWLMCLVWLVEYNESEINVVCVAHGCE